MKKNKFYYVVDTPICIFPPFRQAQRPNVERKGRKTGNELKTVFFVLLFFFGLFSNNVFSQQYDTVFNFTSTPAAGVYIARDSIQLLPANDGNTGFDFKATNDSTFDASIGLLLDGHNCESAVTINPTDSVKLIVIPVADSIYWINFVATDSSIYFCMHNFLSDTGFVNYMTLYNAPNNCNAYTQVSNINGIYLHYGNLSIGNTYLLKLENNGRNLIINELSFYTGNNKAIQGDSIIFDNLPDTVCLGYQILINPEIEILASSLTNCYPLFGTGPGAPIVGVIFNQGCADYNIYYYYSDSLDPASVTYTGYVTCDPDFSYTSNCTTYNFTASTCVTPPYLSSMGYFWDFGDGTIANPSLSPTVTHTYTNTGIDTVTLYLGDTITPAWVYISKIITVNSPAQIQFNLPNPYASQCFDETISIEASLPTSIGSVIYNWYDVSGDTIASNTPTYTIQLNTNTTYKVIGTDSSGCLYIGYFVVTVTPPVELSIIPSLPCPPLQGINLYVPYYPNITYKWSNPWGTHITTVPDTINNINVNWNNHASGWVYVYGYDSNGCLKYYGKLWIDTTAFASLPTYSPVIITKTWIGGSPPQLEFSVPNDTNVSYVWHLPGGVSITSTPTDSSAITVIWGNADNDTVSVDGYDINDSCHAYHGTLYIDTSSCVPSAIQLNSLTTDGITQALGLPPGNYIVSNNTNPIIFNGVTTIDKNLKFVNCPNLMLGSNARINVMPNVTLTFDSCTIKQACDSSWDGMYTQSYTSKIVINNDTIRDAKNAVVSDNGGNFQITSTQFINDSISLWVHNYNPPWIYDFNGNQIAPAAHPGYIASSTFTQNINLTGFYSTTHLTAIVVDTVYNLTIGDSINTNFYSHLQWGIKTKRSQVYIINSNFDSIYYTNLSTPTYIGNGEPNEAAIFCKTEIETVVPPSMPLINQVTIYKCTVGNCNTGIYGYHVQINVIGNMLSQITHNAIHLKDFGNPSTVVNNYAYQNSGVYDVNNNLHNFTIVAEQSNSNASVILDISYNYVGVTNGFIRSGIYISNCNGALYGSSHCTMQDNEFDYSAFTSSTLYEYGIKALNCNYAEISGNTFLSGTVPVSTYHNKLFGIYLNAVKNAHISNNQIIEMGDGIYVYGSSLGSQYFCNEFKDCWYGFFISYATLSDQMLDHTASDNYWYDIPPVSNTSALRRLWGNSISITHINWYHQGLTNDSTNTFSPYLTNMNPLSLYITPMQNTTASNCKVFSLYSKSSLNETTDTTTNTTSDTLIINATGRDQLMGDIVKDSVTYQNFEQENKYTAKEFAYKLIDETPLYMNLNTSEDTIYQYFYDTVNSSNSGSFYQIGKYINAQNYNTATNLNFTLTGINTIENNRIAVNSIYLDKVANNQFLGESDSSTLVNIAYQSPLTGGDAVISARAILSIDLIDETEGTESKSILNKEDTVSTVTIKVYPNPANDKLYIILDGAMDGKANVEMFDLTGKLIYSVSINATVKLQTLNISSIKASIYNLRITTINQIYNQKLVIIK